MASLSTNAIGAANSTAKPPAKSGAADTKNTGDTSPFELMLAATAAQQQAKPAQAPDDANQAAKKPDGSNSDNATTEQTAAGAAAKTQSADDQSAASQFAAGQSAAAKSAGTEFADAEAADIKTAQTKADDKSDAANDNDSAQQTALAQQPPVPQTPPAQPDANALALVQAALAQQQQPALAATAADNQPGTSATPSAIGAKSAKPQNGATPPQNNGLPADAQDMADIADGIAPQSPGATGNSKNPVTAGQAGAKSVTSDGKPAPSSGDADKIAAQTAGTPVLATPATPAPATIQAQPSSTMTNPAATPVLHQASPIAGAGNVSVSQSVQVSAQAPDTAATMGSLAVAIAAKTQSGSRQFDIRLDPPELGRVEVRLSIDASGKTEAHMTADQPETLNLLQKDSSSLTQALRDAGLDVSQSGLNFSLRGQSGQSANDNGAGRGSRSNLAASRVLDAAQGATSASSFTGSAADGRLDIHV